MQRKIFVKTFGCQMNQYDSNRIIDSVKKIGFKKTEDQENADCFVLNTCHVRDKAKEKVYHEIGRVKQIYKKKSKPIIVVAGCVAQAENEEMLKREPYIDIVIGPQSYHKINEAIEKHNEKKQNELTDFDTITKFDFFDKIKNKSTKVSAFITIQEGCDKFCNFCVVPFTRGPECSRSFHKILSEAEILVKNGAREIILLGQNVNAYSFIDNLKEYKLSNLINQLQKYSEIERIRYTTSHPKDMTEDLIDCYKNNKKLMPLVHLPIQSGSNKILNLMNRKHTVEEYLAIYEKLKKINSSIEFSSDFIISYPEETDQDFNDTLNLVRKIKFINSYSFIFSPRPGTNAAKKKLIDKKISQKRLLTLQKYLFGYQINKNKSYENKIIDVLVENKMKDQKKLFGRNKYMNSVIFEGDESDIGKIVKVKITASNQNSLFGKKNINRNTRAA